MDFFKKEYSKYNPENKIWINGLFSAIVVFLLFLLFQPFGFRDKETEIKLVLFPGYAFLAFINAHFNFLIVRYILKKKKIWTRANEFLSLIISTMLLTIAVHLFTHWAVDDMPLNIQWYFKLLYHVASLFLVIGILEFFYYNYRSASIGKKQISSKYKTAKQKLHDATKQNMETISITLENEKIEINRNKIIYIQSVGNYLEFCLREPNGEINRIIKRGRLHQTEKDLAPFSEFFRCHRAFIINIKYAIQIKGNMKNARVVFEGKPLEIPVSRSLYKSLKEHLEKITLS